MLRINQLDGKEPLMLVGRVDIGYILDGSGKYAALYWQHWASTPYDGYWHSDGMDLIRSRFYAETI